MSQSEPSIVLELSKEYNVDKDVSFYSNTTNNSVITRSESHSHVESIILAKSIFEEKFIARTSVQYKNIYPEWNEYISISPIQFLDNACIHFRVKDSSKLGNLCII